MSRHPLDISQILIQKGVALVEDEAPVAAVSAVPREGRKMIRDEFWKRLRPECRRILAGRTFQHVDFNPMLAELQDIEKMDESWLRWAIPTYMNGLSGGPIRDWLDGRNREKDFHYVLVGEHLRYLKAKRAERREAKALSRGLGEFEAIVDRIRDMGRRLEEYAAFFLRQGVGSPA